MYQKTKERTVVHQLSVHDCPALEFAQSEEVEWIISDKQNLILHRPDAPTDPISVKKTQPILETILGFLEGMPIDDKERKHLGRLSRHILSQLVCMGRHTITNLRIKTVTTNCQIIKAHLANVVY